MSDLPTITARDANHRLAELLRAVETGAPGFLVTRRGRPVARILPVEGDRGAVDAARRAALDLVMGTHWTLERRTLDRDALHER